MTDQLATAGGTTDIDGRRLGTRALIVHPVLRSDALAIKHADAALEEARGLAEAISLKVLDAAVARIERHDAGTFFRKGTVEAWAEKVKEHGAELVVVDGQISPVQQRNLEKAWKCKVIDRTALILEIFGARAQTREGRLQVELAHLLYQRTRLVRSWTHLERQRGGGGFLGGPGETQLELDKRHLGDRILKLQGDLAEVSTRRELHRKSREAPIVALVGYTNAGKSTLFNRLTGAEVMAKDMLFATLDPTMRGIVLPSGQKAVLSDTVGFISNLPTHLVAAFRATLEEVVNADIIVHVRDIAHIETERQRQSVNQVLGELGLSADVTAGTVIEALNKIDRLDPAARAVVEEHARRSNAGIQVPLSALTGEGCDRLLGVLDDRLGSLRKIVELAVPHTEGAALAWLYRHGEIIDRQDGEFSSRLKLSINPIDLERFRQKFPGYAAGETKPRLDA
ncbi:MAG: GTPase HflX [Alphaproteobacteria bacterium]